MLFTSMMHIALYTDQMDAMRQFYCEQLGASVKVLTRYKAYLHRDDRPENQAIAKTDPERIFNLYLEIAPGQFLELFPKMKGQKEHTPFNEHLGYSHYSLLVDDIFATRKKLIANGVVMDTDISKGPSETYQMWVSDPDGNRIEIMQFTDQSWQVIGHADPTESKANP